MDVANDLQSRFRAKSIHSFQLDLPPEDLLEADNLIVINATSLGLRENDPAPFDLSLLGSNTKVYEMIYNPPKTQLLVQAESLGFDHASGLSMLVHQAAKALEIWTKREVSVSAMYDGLNAIQIFS